MKSIFVKYIAAIYYRDEQIQNQRLEGLLQGREINAICMTTTNAMIRQYPDNMGDQRASIVSRKITADITANTQ